MKGQVLLGVQLLLAAMLMWASFCRLTRTDGDTHREVRWSILFQFIAAGAVLGAPVLPFLMPDVANWRPLGTPRWIWLLLLGSIAIQQLVTMKYWRSTCPAQFQKAVKAESGPAFAFALLLAAVGAMTVVPTSAAAQAEDKSWLPVPSGMAYMPAGSEAKCSNPEGCVVFTVPALKEALRQAGGTCGHIPPLPAPRGTDT